MVHGLERDLILMTFGVFTLGYFFVLFLRFCEVSVALAVHHCAIQTRACVCIRVTPPYPGTHVTRFELDKHKDSYISSSSLSCGSRLETLISILPEASLIYLGKSTFFTPLNPSVLLLYFSE